MRPSSSSCLPSWRSSRSRPYGFLRAAPRGLTRLLPYARNETALPVEAHSTDLMRSPLQCFAALCLVIAAAPSGRAQNQGASLELTELSRYLGTWTYDGE